MQDFDPWNGWRNAAGNITSALMQSPMIKAQAAETQMRTQFYNQQAQLHAQERAAMERKGRLVTALEQSGPQAVFDAQSGVSDSPAIRTVIGATSALSGEHPGVVTETFGKWLQMTKGVKDKDPTAVFAGSTGRGLPKGQAISDAQRQQLIQEDRITNQALNATRENVARINASRPVVVPDNSMMVDPATGQTMNYGMQRVGLGDTLFNGDVGLRFNQVAKGGNKNQVVPPGAAVMGGEDGNKILFRNPSSSSPVNEGTRAKIDVYKMMIKSALESGDYGKAREMMNRLDEASAEIQDQRHQNGNPTPADGVQQPGGSSTTNIPGWPSEQEDPLGGEYGGRQTVVTNSPDSGGQAQGGFDSFSDEETARGYGLKDGDIFFHQGEGKLVRLSSQWKAGQKHK